MKKIINNISKRAKILILMVYPFIYVVLYTKFNWYPFWLIVVGLSAPGALIVFWQSLKTVYFTKEDIKILFTWCLIILISISGISKYEQYDKSLNSYGIVLKIDESADNSNIYGVGVFNVSYNSKIWIQIK